MKRRPTEPVVQMRPAKALPCWENLPSKERRAIMIALTAMMVKRLPGRDGAREDNGE